MSSESNYAFMKSGTDTNSDEYDKAILEKDIASFLIYFMDKSMTNMETYMSHHCMKTTPINLLKKCLKAEIFMYNNRPNYKKDIQKIKNEFISDLLTESDNDSECTEDTDTEQDIEYNSTMIQESAKESENGIKICNCGLCTFIDNIGVRWVNWKPKSVLENILKERIEEID